VTRRTRSGRAKTPARGRGVIVLAGEDRNDCEIMAALIHSHRPDLSDVAKLVRISDPVRLRKKTGTDLAAAVKVIVGKARAKALQQRAQLHGIVVHEDWDGVTGARSAHGLVASPQGANQSYDDFLTDLAGWSQPTTR
jgi:hypothetical protein